MTGSRSDDDDAGEAPDDDDDAGEAPGDDDVDGVGEDDAGEAPDDDDLDRLLAAVAASPPIHAAGDEDLLVGRSLGRFVITARLGKGGMGVVYRARDPELRRDVAIKVLPAEASRDPERRMRFLREARAAAGLSHPSIAAIHDVGFDEREQLAFIAMEVIEGQELRRRLGTPLSVGEVEHIALQVARGLARAHAAGVVHRDLKPENIMITRDGDAKILDFGLAKNLDPAQKDGKSTVDGAVMGTPGYMAPEQVKAQAVDARADVFAFGVVLYEMLAGRAPFGGSTPFAAALAVTVETPPPLERPDAAALVALVARCLEKDPAGRPRDGRALVEALGHPTVSGPHSRAMSVASTTPLHTVATPQALQALPATAAAAPRPRRRSRVVAAAVVALAVAAVGGAAVALRPVSSEARLRGLIADPNAKIACTPLTVSGDIHARELGLSVAGRLCANLKFWGGHHFDGPAAMLGLPVQGSASFPEDPFFTEEGQQALAKAATRYSAVIGGAVDVDKNGMLVTLRVDVAGADPIVIDGVRAERFDMHQMATLRALLQRVESRPQPFADDARQLLGFNDADELFDCFSIIERLPTDPAGSCAAFERYPRFAGIFSAACGHPERNDDGVPLWPASLPADAAAMPPEVRAYWRVQWQPLSVEQAREVATVLGAARKQHTGLAGLEYTTCEAKAHIAAGDNERARTVLDVAVALQPDNDEVSTLRYPLEADQEKALRAATAWGPHSVLWAMRAYWTHDPQKALPMQELAYFESARDPQSIIPLARMMLASQLPERARSLASFHLERNRGDDARAAELLLGAHEWGTGRPGAAHTRFHRAAVSADTLDQLTLAATARAGMLEELLSIPPTVADEVVERYLLATPPRVDGLATATAVLDLFAYARPDLSRRALPVVVDLLKAGRLYRGDLDTDLDLRGYQLFLAGDARGAAELWRRDAGVWGRYQNAVIFESAGALDLAEVRYRAFVTHDPRGMATMQAVKLARLLMKRGDVDEARTLAAGFVNAWEHTDVPMPLVAEMQALLKAP